METTNKLFYSGTKFFTENEEDYRITVRISLDDDCKNNICDWSITADVDWKNKHGKYEDYLGGCCHDEVAKHFPELAKFISLHLCNHYGAPMYPVENGIYHVRRSGMSVAMEYLRISEQECVELYKASEDKLYFRYMLFNLGIVDRWKRESEELIAELEKLCGKFYASLNQKGILKIEDGLSAWENQIEKYRFATESERQKLVDALKASKEPEAKEYLKRFFGIEEKPKYEFKPFDKVLVRKEGNKKWNISLFAREIVDDYNGLPYKYECSNGTLWDYCIHFEGNEHLLGTDEAL